MDLCREYEIDVLLDIPTRPAPVWLHKKHPALLSFCLCNELGAGFKSYSAEVQVR